MEASIMSPGGEETVKVAGGFDEVITEREHEHEVALVFWGETEPFFILKRSARVGMIKDHGKKAVF